MPASRIRASRSHPTRLLALAMATAAVWALPTAVPVAVAAPGAPGDFYTPPEPLPSGAPGTVVRSEPSVSVIVPGTPAVLDAVVTRLMYLSENVGGHTEAVTGTLLVPRSPWTGPGPRPVVAMGPGTQGAGDQCAPSKLMTFGQEYENLQIGPLLAAGYTVALTDYMGLGTPGVHTYLNRVDEGRALLDVARASRSMTTEGVSAAAPVALWGYSQGGHAAGAAAELAPSYAPELPIIGAFVGAPAPSLFDLAEYGDGSILSGGIGWVISGFIAAYPARTQNVLSLFNDRGREILDRSQNSCIYDAPRINPFVSTTEYTRDGRPISAHLQDEPLRSLTAEQTLGSVSPNVPILLAQNATDDLVAERGTRALETAWCDGGTTVASLYPNYPRILPKVGVGHILGLATVVTALDWLRSRVEQTPAPNTCGSR